MNYIILLFCLIWLRLNLKFFFKKDNPREEEFKSHSDQMFTFYAFLTVFVVWFAAMVYILTDLPNIPIIKFLTALVILIQFVQAIKTMNEIISDEKLIYRAKLPKDYINHTLENILILYLIYYYSVVKLNLFSF